jgi:hypothetical protein
MSRITVLLGVTVLAATGVVSYLLAMRRDARGAEVHRAVVNPGQGLYAAELKAEVTGLRIRLAELNSEVDSLKETKKTAGGGERQGRDPSPASPQKSREAREKEWEQKHSQMIADLESSFRTEAQNPAWSAETTATIQAALRSEDVLLTAAAQGLECRSRSCRLELTDDGSGKLAKALPMFAQRIAQPLPDILADHKVSDDGTAKYILYLLPAMPTSPSTVTR